MSIENSTNSVTSSAAGSTHQPLLSSLSKIVHRRTNIQWVQNVLLTWLDSSIDNNSDDFQNTITQLRRVMNEINTFTDGEQCIQFIEATKDHKVCMVISRALGQLVVPRVHDMSQVDSIFIFCGNKKLHKEWSKDWSKIKGVFTQIDPICEALEVASKQCEQDAMPIGFVATNDGVSNRKLNHLDPSFMYAGILKKILFTIQVEPKHFNEYIEHCCAQFVGNDGELNNTKKLGKGSWNKTPIWWYSCDCFLYPMLNLSLRTMDSDIIIKMEFFINDLYHQMEQLYFEQFGAHLGGEHFNVYRGRGLPITSFEQMKKYTRCSDVFQQFRIRQQEASCSHGIRSQRPN